MLGTTLHRSLGVLLACLTLLLGACASPLEHARESHAAGRYAEVVEALADEDERDAEAYMLLGEAQLELGDLDAAEGSFKALRVARNRRPELVFRALFGLGNVSLLRWDGRSALEWFSAARVASVSSVESDACDVGITYARELLDADAADADATPRPDLRLPGPPRPLPVPPTAPQPEARADRPGVIPRSDWGARPIDRGDAEPMNGITRVTVHHTGEPRTVQPTSRETDAKRMRRYQEFHVESRQWADIGYHFVIDPSGRVWEGRRLRYQGAHAGNGASNRHNVGIALMGNFELAPPNDAQRRTLRAVLRWLIREHGIAEGGLYTHQAIKKEYGLPGTACPGKHLIRYVEELRQELSGDFSALPRVIEDTATAGGREEPGSPCLCGGHRAPGLAAR